MAKMDKGWFKTYREVFHDEYLMANPPLFETYMLCAAMASPIDDVELNNGIQLKIGQFVTSYLKMSDYMCCSRKTAFTRLHALQRHGYITLGGNTKGTLITVENKGFWSKDNSKSEQLEKHLGKRKREREGERRGDTVKESTYVLKNQRIKEMECSDEPEDDDMFPPGFCTIG